MKNTLRKMPWLAAAAGFLLIASSSAIPGIESHGCPAYHPGRRREHD